MVIGTYICIDYHELSNTIENRFPIPRIDDILDRLQIQCMPEYMSKTPFPTLFGY